MRRGIHTPLSHVALSRIATATVLGAVVALSACKNGGNGKGDTATMVVTNMAGDTVPLTAANMPTPEMIADATIVAELFAVNQSEIDAGKMALTKATNADVKAFAQTMVTDHTKMLDDVDALSKRLNISPDPMAADSLHMANKTVTDKLNAAKGAAFDTAYVNAQVIGHQNALDMLKSSVDKTKNADLKKALTDAQPAVQHHLDQIKSIQSKLK